MCTSVSYHDYVQIYFNRYLYIHKSKQLVIIIFVVLTATCIIILCYLATAAGCRDGKGFHGIPVMLWVNCETSLRLAKNHILNFRNKSLNLL